MFGMGIFEVSNQAYTMPGCAISTFAACVAGTLAD
jgi:hypothetical protein